MPKVRTERATAFFSTRAPKIGIFKVNISQPTRPGGNFRSILMNSHKPMGMPGKRNHQLPTQCDMAIRAWVMAGSSVPKSWKILMNCGTIFNMMKTRMPTAKVTTVTG